MKHRKRDGSVRSKAVPCRRDHGCEPVRLDRIQGDANDLVRETSGLNPLRALSTAVKGSQEGESEWYQWLEVKKPVDWEPHTSIALVARPVRPRRKSWAKSPP